MLSYSAPISASDIDSTVALLLPIWETLCFVKVFDRTIRWVVPIHKQNTSTLGAQHANVFSMVCSKILDSNRTFPEHRPLFLLRTLFGFIRADSLHRRIAARYVTHPRVVWFCGVSTPLPLARLSLLHPQNSLG